MTMREFFAWWLIFAAIIAAVNQFFYWRWWRKWEHRNDAA
jgi:hypothetical protein